MDITLLQIGNFLIRKDSCDQPIDEVYQIKIIGDKNVILKSENGHEIKMQKLHLIESKCWVIG